MNRKKVNHKEIVQNLAMVTQLGLNMMAPVILCAFAGSWLDEKFGWSVTAVLLILGVLAGARNSWLLLKQIGMPDKKRRQKNEEQTNK